MGAPLIPTSIRTSPSGTLGASAESRKAGGMARDKVRNGAGGKECRFLSLSALWYLNWDKGPQSQNKRKELGREDEILTDGGDAELVCGVSRGLHRACARIRC